ncbi:hypothetical protein LTR66_008405 [Elasticomyces elasticus]|nr:hypothetical protein LTR66_008405 [Elasticomyces elasticus]
MVGESHHGWRMPEPNSSASSSTFVDKAPTTVSNPIQTTQVKPKLKIPSIPCLDLPTAPEGCVWEVTDGLPQLVYNGVSKPAINNEESSKSIPDSKVENSQIIGALTARIQQLEARTDPKKRTSNSTSAPFGACTMPQPPPLPSGFDHFSATYPPFMKSPPPPPPPGFDHFSTTYPPFVKPPPPPPLPPPTYMAPPPPPPLCLIPSPPSPLLSSFPLIFPDSKTAKDKKPFNDRQNLDESWRSSSPPRPRRRRSFSRSRSRSSSIVSHRRLDYVLEEVNTSSDLIRIYSDDSDEDSEDFETDAVVLLKPFNQKAYTTRFEASSIDFKQYEWLIKYAQPGRWYSWIGAEDLAQLSKWERNPACHEMLPVTRFVTPLERVKPTRLEVPRIDIGRALSTSTVPHDGCLCGEWRKKHDGKDCADYAGDKSLTYYSVLESKHGTPSSHHERPLPMYEWVNENRPRDVTVGAPIFKVVKSSSRKAAAAQAFYDAGANSWSTVFVCVLPGVDPIADVDAEVTFEHITTRRDLLREAKAGEELRVLY